MTKGKAVILEVTFGSDIYEIRFVPLSLHFTQYFIRASRALEDLAGQPDASVEDTQAKSDALFNELIAESEVEYLETKKTADTPEKWSSDIAKLPGEVVAAWSKAALTNAVLRAEVKVKQEKN